MLCDVLEGWGEGSGREAHEGGDIYIYLRLIHIVVQQELTQHCKVVILQLKKSHLKNDNLFL